MGLQKSVLLTLLAGVATSQIFAAEPGFYVGASGGVTTATLEEDFVIGGSTGSIDLDEDETGFKIYAGYQFNEWLGIEGGYGVLGEPSVDETFINPLPPNQATNVELEVEINALQGFLVGTIPLGESFEIFGKIGAASLSTDSELQTSGPLQVSTSTSNGNDDSMMAYGGGVAFNFGDGHWAVRVEYEGYDADTLDDLSFVSAGLLYRFFAPPPPPPVAAPAPAPAPRPAVAATPAKAPDGDRDGVPDATDQCPTTPAGARVGPGGCDCEYTLQLAFAFDSAELTAADKAKIDEIVPVLKNPKVAFIAGEVNGYSDSTGEEAYNVGLSKRRAESVANYVKSQGVNLGTRFVTEGYGEAHPIASNDTPEGRAQNRRVVLRRTDCGSAH